MGATHVTIAAHLVSAAGLIAMVEPWIPPLQRALAAQVADRPVLAQYRLRAATAADEAWLYALHRDALRGYVDQTWGWEEDWQREHFRTHYRAADNAVVVHARTVADDVGRISVTRHWQALFLRDIELDAAHRGLGLGSALLRALLQVAASGGKPVELHVLRCNPAQHLYTRLGFRVAGGDEARLLMRTA